MDPQAPCLLPSCVSALVGATLPLSAVLVELGKVAARAGRSPAALVAFWRRSAMLGHGWAAHAGDEAEVRRAGGSAASFERWRVRTVAEADAAANPALPAGIDPPANGAALVARTATGREAWTVRACGDLVVVVVVVTRPAGGELCHVVAASAERGDAAGVGAAHEIALVARSGIPLGLDELTPADEAERAAAGCVRAVAIDGAVTLHPAPRLDAGRLAWARHLQDRELISSAVERQGAGLAQHSAEVAHEAALAQILGRPMPRR